MSSLIIMIFILQVDIYKVKDFTEFQFSVLILIDEIRQFLGYGSLFSYKCVDISSIWKVRNTRFGVQEYFFSGNRLMQSLCIYLQ